jgi:hypothetical protein
MTKIIALRTVANERDREYRINGKPIDKATARTCVVVPPISRSASATPAATGRKNCDQGKLDAFIKGVNPQKLSDVDLLNSAFASYAFLGRKFFIRSIKTA